MIKEQQAFNAHAPSQNFFCKSPDEKVLLRHMWWKSNHMSSPCCKFAFSSPSVASQSTSAIPDKFKCTNLVFCWYFSLTILNWCRFVNRRFGLYISTACGIFFSNFKTSATMTKIRPAVQIGLESLYHHVKLLLKLSGKFVQTIFQLESHLGLNSSDLILIFSLKIWILHAWASLTQSKAISKYIC